MREKDQCLLPPLDWELELDYTSAQCHKHARYGTEGDTKDIDKARTEEEKSEGQQTGGWIIRIRWP